MFPAPPEVLTSVFTELPAKFRRTGRSGWGDHNKHGASLHSFLEGPCFDTHGNLYVVDIPWGRIFRIREDAEWELFVEYDGWPNGLKFHRDGRLFVADYRRGILAIDPETRTISTVVSHWRSESLKGVNDLSFADNGDLWFTDQGQTGMTDATGRVFRLTAAGELCCLSDRVPSPNGIVQNRNNTAVLVATRENAIWHLPVHADGTTSKVRVFIQLSGGGGPDGLAMDVDDGLAVCHAGLGSVWLFSPLGEPLLRVRSCRGVSTTNLAFGGADRRTLYMTEAESGAILIARAPRPGRKLFSDGDQTPRQT
jgi:gluconolactonase